MRLSNVLRYFFVLWMPFLLLFTAANATVYSDAENGNDGWFVYDNTPDGATVSVVNDVQVQSNVIQTLGDGGRLNGYRLGGTGTTDGWNNSTEALMSWQMATAEPFAFIVHVATTQGVRRLVYTESNVDALKYPGNDSIGFGLGRSIMDGVWRDLQRDLRRDVEIGEPGNQLLAVNGVSILGSLRLDNLDLGNSTDEPTADDEPTAEIEISAVSGTAPLTVLFGAAASTAVPPATIASYAWDFGNGTTAASAGASTTYSNAGSYSVSLTVTDSNGLSDAATATIAVQGVDEPLTGESEAAARLLAQATFGATLADIAAVERLGIEGWVDDQFTRQGEPYLDYVRTIPGTSSLTGPRHDIWMIDAIDGDDQLRQRVAFAYSQILVVSDVSQNLDRAQYAMTNYYDILRNNAFGNYRDLLEEVTMSPVMGLYLSMLQNAQGDLSSNTRADENFAREIMQLFSIGLYELNLDGSIRRDANGDPLPAYTQQDVEEYARVYTGWNYADADRWDRSPDSGLDMIQPMKPFPGFHDLGSKNLLRGVVSPAGISPEQDLDIALDSLFNHPNVGPFIGKLLIKRLVTSNPTPAYITRVASVFNNNGSGVRGDMQAVIRAILLDVEARSGHVIVPNFGKIREPLIRWTHLWRAFNVQRGNDTTFNRYITGSPYLTSASAFLGQQVLGANSVFNFFSPDYAPLGSIREAGLTAPEAQIYTDANILSTTSKLSGLAHFYYQGGDENTRNDSYIDISAEMVLAADPEALIERLDLLLMSGQMSTGMRTVLVNHMNNLPADEAGRSLRVRDALVLIMASPQYLVQK